MNRSFVDGIRTAKYGASMPEGRAAQHVARYRSVADPSVIDAYLKKKNYFYVR